MPGKEIDKYISPTILDNPDVNEGLARVGLSPEFPSKLRRLNDVLAENSSQFAGLKITLTPSFDDPMPIVEVKRGRHRQVVVDMDVDPNNPVRSTGRIQITDEVYDSLVGTQRLSNLKELLRELYGDSRKLMVRGKNKRIELLPEDEAKLPYNLPIISNDFLEMVLNQWQNLKDTITYALFKENSSESILTFRVPHEGGLKERLVWIESFSYEGNAADVENAIELLADFFSYDADPEVVEDIGGQ